MSERELSHFDFLPSIDWKQWKATMRNCAGEAPILWHLVVLGPHRGSSVQWCSPIAGLLGLSSEAAAVAAQQCSCPRPSLPEPDKNCTLCSFSFGVFLLLGLLSSCWNHASNDYVDAVELNMEIPPPFFSVHRTPVYKIACLRCSVKCLGFI